MSRRSEDGIKRSEPHGRRSLGRTLAVTATMSLVLMSRSRGDGEPLPTEYEVKAAYLYNFARFVEWPADAFSAPSTPFVVAVLGDDPFGSVLEQTFENKKIFNRDISIVRTQLPEEAARAHMIFISASEARVMSQVSQALAGRSVLSVGDLPDMARHGAVIGFRMEDTKVRFDINMIQAQQTRLKLSSQLLKVARIVGG